MGQKEKVTGMVGESVRKGLAEGKRVTEVGEEVKVGGIEQFLQVPHSFPLLLNQLLSVLFIKHFLSSYKPPLVTLTFFNDLVVLANIIYCVPFHLL